MASETVCQEALTIDVVEDHSTFRDIIRKIISDPKRNCPGEESEDPFFVVDLGEVLRLHKEWKSLLPRVKPFYAVKSNDDPGLLRVLEKLGTGFDCASKSEMERVLDLGADPSRIIHAHPYKQPSHIRFTENKKICLTVFNHEEELHKIKSIFPTTKLLLRIQPDTNLQFPATKFGASVEEVDGLLKVARDLSLDVVGVSFHVGWYSVANDLFERAVKLARDVFDRAPKYGYHFSILDVGGGFRGRPWHGVTFEEQAKGLSAALEQYFPEECGTEIIAEPGQYFCTAPYTLAVNIIAKQKTNEGIMYYIAEGISGSFIHTILGRNDPLPTPNLFEPLELHSSIDPLHPSIIYGRSLANFDWIERDCMLPEMNTDDWMVVKEKGAYTYSTASNFNGFNKASSYYFVRQKDWTELKVILK